MDRVGWVSREVDRSPSISFLPGMPGRCNRNALVAVRTQIEKVQGSRVREKDSENSTAILLDFLNPEIPNP
ncbi:MAG: hypothetical protein MZV70_60710 [Desulfobacterales bacterium]|nr:hypothetical protein [Desulfobacterales bacterium]